MVFKKTGKNRNQWFSLKRREIINSLKLHPKYKLKATLLLPMDVL
jgi:hypothetical protein